NGYSLVRRIVEKSGLSWSDPAPFDPGNSLAQSFLIPTRMYVKSCLKAIDGADVKALAHITGGGLVENIPRVLPDQMSAVVDTEKWPMPPVFKWLQAEGNVAADEMYRAFNTGIGMVLVVAAPDADKVVEILSEAGESALPIGVIAPRGADAVTVENSEAPWRA
ncbi:MAG: AIR synthase-related protein, partial [Cytophagales bacterium]|nr:AIR synthase-related protein [Cytophagales bacterium]